MNSFTVVSATFKAPLRIRATRFYAELVPPSTPCVSPQRGDEQTYTNSHFNRPIPPPTDDLVSNEIDAIHFVRVSRKIIFEFVCLEVPDLNKSINGSTGVGGNDRTRDGAYFDRVIFACTDHHPRVRAPREPIHWTDVTTQRRHEFAHSP